MKGISDRSIRKLKSAVSQSVSQSSRQAGRQAIRARERSSNRGNVGSSRWSRKSFGSRCPERRTGDPPQATHKKTTISTRTVVSLFFNPHSAVGVTHSCCMPILMGYFPVMSAARAGVQSYLRPSKGIVVPCGSHGAHAGEQR